MTTLTFDSFHSASHAPRRAKARRATRPAVQPAQALPTAAAVRPDLLKQGLYNKTGLTILAGAAVLLHAAIIVGVHNLPADAKLPPPKAEPLALEFAPPPPPPPPPEPPKPQPQPQVVKQAPAPQPLPVVRNVVDSGPPTADTVAVATTPQPPAPPAPVAAPPAPPPPEPVTEPRGFAGYKNNPAPEYPALAQDRGLQGQVILKVQVLATGKPSTINIDKSSGHKILDDAAVKAVQGWAFEPARRGQTPIDGWVKVPLNFKLS
ncbi:TonB family protein [Duganella sp. FT92W]|uniref:Protein TonB n=1 Tax=Pseudoduganella rivuli TaxID=2666085 RepID=A0A7X2IQU9_9BURK|nr:energy transducer TonB [Pseudoduganella rivuli]MRV74410.1 TonB family protein [Pseudoduganella rivuli]